MEPGRWGNEMKTLNVISARSIWLFDINDLNPRGKDIVPELLGWLKENYQFDKAPASINDVSDVKSFKFERGRFMVKEEIYIAVDLEIYNDGIIGNSRSSTRDTDKFLEDVLSFAAREFSLTYDPRMIRSKTHASELTVRFEPSLFNLHPKLVDIANTIQSLSGLTDMPTFEMTGFGISTDATNSALKPAPFLLERRLGSPFSEKRFYSKAPLHTDDHEAVLTEIENILTPKSR